MAQGVGRAKRRSQKDLLQESTDFRHKLHLSLNSDEKFTSTEQRATLREDSETVDYNSKYHIPFEDDHDAVDDCSRRETTHGESTMDLLMRPMASMAMTTERQNATMTAFMTNQASRLDNTELQKAAIENLKAWEPGMNLPSYIQKFEDSMLRGRNPEAKWCGIMVSQLKGQLWQDWVDNEADGDEAGYEQAKEMVLEMHGTSLLKCITCCAD